MNDLRNLWDILVIGAGPAGSLAAREAARAGLSVLLVDRARFPRRKVCGGCLNARALETLRDAGLGDLPARLGARPVAALRLGVGGRVARLPLEGGLAVSREALDAALAGAAADAGAVFLPETEAQIGAASDAARGVRLSHQGIDRNVRTRVVIAAGGLGGSPAEGGQNHAEAAGEGGQSHAEAAGEGGERIAVNSRIGAGAAFADAPGFYGGGEIHMACGPGGYVGLVRVENNLLNVAAALDPGFVRDSGGPARAAARVLASAGWPPLPDDPVPPWRGTPFLTRRRRCVAGKRLLVVGDAAGYVEPFTGEGMAWALGGARAVVPFVVEAARGWRPAIAAAWARDHARRLRRRRLLCGAVAALLRRPALAMAAAGLATSAPRAARAIAGEFWGRARPMEAVS